MPDETTQPPATPPEAEPQTPAVAQPVVGIESPAASSLVAASSAPDASTPPPTEAVAPTAPTAPAAPTRIDSPPIPRLPMPQPQVTVLQPLTNLKDVVLPTRPDDEEAMLATWSAAMERALREGRPADSVRLAHVVLRQLPRHLATYNRLIRAAWELRRWEEGDAWGRRLLRADPSNPLAWRAVAMAAEQRADRARAHTRWQRAFECDPYDPDTRAGLVRTSLDLARLPALNEACLGALHLRGGRWEQAATQYRRLVQADSRRLDFQSGLLIALWQSHTQPEAYEMALRLTQAQPFLLIAWTVVDAVGNADDQALARHPLSTMDPDGDYLRGALLLNAPSRPVRLAIKRDDRALLTACGGALTSPESESRTQPSTISKANV